MHKQYLQNFFPWSFLRMRSSLGTYLKMHATLSKQNVQIQKKAGHKSRPFEWPTIKPRKVCFTHLQTMRNKLFICHISC